MPSARPENGARSDRVTGRTIGHYRLIEWLGAGGMGEVFRAEDLALGRDTALKLLPRAFNPDLRLRLLREAEASAKLQHPAIATFYETGEADGETFIAMELVHGPTLRNRLGEGPLAADHALAITRCLLEALEHAHVAGILHRDIKPENIILTGAKSAKLLDFGIAKPIFAANDDLTHLGGLPPMTLGGDSRLAGTIGYLAPEQVLGDPLDARTDVFQVAAVLYEMLTGRLPFGGSSAMERLGAVLVREPDLEAIAHDGPQGLALVLRRGLARLPANRYASAAAFLRDLQDLSEGRLVSTLPTIIAVVDFENLTGDANLDWLGTAVGESLRGELEALPGVTVLARDKVLHAVAALQSGKRTADAVAVALQLGGGWAVSGNYQLARTTLRLTARLFDATTGRAVVTERAEGQLDDLFTIEDRLAHTVVSALNLPAVPANARRPDAVVEAHEYYARARVLLDRLGKASVEEARGFLERAVAVDPRHADALAALANAYAFRSISTTDPHDLARALQFADRALAVEPSHAVALVWRIYALYISGRVDEALAADRLAVALNPGNAESHYFAGVHLLFQGNAREALPFMQRAVELEGANGMSWLALGSVHLRLERLEEARYSFTRAQKLESGACRYPTAGAAAYAGEVSRIKGRLDQARSEALAGIEAAENSDHAYRDTFRAYGLGVLGRVALDQGDMVAARAAFSQVLAQAHGRPRTRACGRLVVRAMAGLAHAAGDGAVLDDACRLLDERTTYDFEPFYGALEENMLFDLALAAHALGRADQARSLLARARDAGGLGTLPDDLH